MSFWDGFEKQAGKYKDYATDVGVNTALGGGIAAGINAVTRKKMISIKGSALISGGLAALLSAPKLLRKEGARMSLGIKSLTSGNTAKSMMKARPIPMRANAGAFKPTPLPSASGAKYNPSVPKAKTPSADKLKMPTINDKQTATAGSPPGVGI